MWKSRGLWLRILLCWGLGSTLPFFDEVNQFDFRFGIRGSQESDKQIVLVYFDQEDWNVWHGPNNNLLRSLKEFNVVSDSYFWRSSTWNTLLSKILSQNPATVGVTFFFNPQLPTPDEGLKSLSDPRVIWAGQLDHEGRPALPLMANSYGYNVALVDLREDEDRVLRRFAPSLAPLPHMGVKLAEPTLGTSVQEVYNYLGESRLINFRGPKGTYPAVEALDILQGRVPPEFFKNKIVLIGTNSVASHIYQTPMGRMSRVDIVAQVVDNVIHDRWIERLAPWFTSLYMLLVLLLAVAILVNYPQSVALVFMLWLGLGTSAFSLWIFDSFNFWIPLFSPLVMALIAYIVFIGYQLSMKENQTWRLEQEKNMLSELDQLRNNFVSLISHDLKTVGSSRVDLQACKLEYSIVSPK